MNRIGFFLLDAACSVTCAVANPHRTDRADQNTDGFIQLPEGWSQSGISEDNGFTDVRWALGRRICFLMTAVGRWQRELRHLSPSCQSLQCPGTGDSRCFRMLGTRNARP